MKICRLQIGLARLKRHLREVFFYEMWNLNIVKNIHSLTQLKECSNCVKTLEDDGFIDDP